MRSLTNIRRVIFGVVIICFLGSSAFGAPRQYIISGFVQTSGGSGVEGVSVVGDNGAGSAVTDANGAYSVTVPNNWSGTITVSKAGWLITPPSKTYSKIRENKANENYTAYQPKISGYVKKADGTALSGASVSASGGASTTTNASGYYEVFVPYGWTGTLSAALAGYDFTAKSYTNVTIEQANQNFTGYQPKISGYVRKADGTALSGATVSASGGASTTTNASGYYEIIVPYGWSGNVSAVKSGYNITPSSIAYSNVISDKSERNYSAFQPTISGSVASYGQPLEGVTLTASNGGGTAVTDSAGSYNLTVAYGWSGTITPSKPQYTFTPVNKVYSNVIADTTSQNYTAILPPVSISGYVRDGSGNGVAGVNITADNGGGSAFTNTSGYYSISVPYNWSGMVTATKTGYLITPDYIDFTNIHSDQTNQNFSAFQPTISGFVKDANNNPVAAVNISTDNSGGSDTTDSNGYYEIMIVYGWSGKVVPMKTGFVFDPFRRIYNSVISDQINQDYLAHVPQTFVLRADGTGDYPTIQAAIDAVVNGDVVVLQAGTFTGDGNRDIDFKGKAITVRGATGDANDCVIDCQGTEAEPHRGFKFVSGENANSVLEGVTITNGYGPDANISGLIRSVGGAIYCNNSSPHISNCIISHNSAAYQGGGISAYEDSSPNIDYCTIINNHANNSGGGVQSSGSNLNIRNCTISYNTSLIGGGIYTYNNSWAFIINCTVSNNLASSVGGIYNYSSNPTISNCIITNNKGVSSAGYGIYNYKSSSTIKNCIISNNSGYTGGGIYNHNNSNANINNCTITSNSASGGIYNYYRSSASVKNCIIWDNQGNQIIGSGVGSIVTVTYSNIQGGYTGVGNINADPLFIDDFHLSLNSPCINAGNPGYVPEPNEQDIDGDPRIIDRIDMGADESTIEYSAGLYLLKKEFEIQVFGIDSNTVPQILEIYNYGAITLNWHIENDCHWLIIEPLSGQTESLQTTEVALSIDHNNINYGIYSCQFRVIDPNAATSPQYVTVNVEVLRPELSIDSSTFNFTVAGIDSNAAPQVLTIQNTGYDSLNWNIEMANDCDWLKASHLTGQAGHMETDEVILSIDHNNIDYGTYSCQLQVTAPDAENSPLVVTVNLEVLGPQIGVNNDYFYFTAYGKSDDVAEQELVITNTGFDTLNWHIEVFDCNWLSVAPQSGQVTDGSSVVAISIDPTKVPAYGYNYATINIIDENASNSPLAVTARLNVLGPAIYVNPYELYIYAERNTKVERTFEIINTGYDILHWNIETPNDCKPSDCNWLEIVEPLSGECAAEESDIVTVTVDANGLEENNDYHTRLFIHSPECGEETVNLNLIVYTSNEIHVPQDYPTIQEAVNAALTGDIIIVHPGKYAGFDVDKPALTIRSIEPENPAVVAATIIESGGYVYGNEIVINGLSFIYNPAVSNQSENGIYISKSSDMQIKNCRVLNFPGAGICVSERNPTGTISISNCVISNNGYLGWGWYYPSGIITSGSANIENCLITGNFGGGILVVGPSELGGCKIYIRNNTIADNFSDITKTSGRGITCGYYYYYYLGLTLSLQNSITSNAVGPNDVEIFIIAEDDPDPNNINLDVAYSNIKGGLAAVSTPIGANVVWGQGNIDADPCFVEPGYWVDANDPNIIVEPNDPNAVWVDGDYHLKSEGWRWDVQRKVWKWDDVTSRCIDAGNPGCPLGEELLSVPDDPNNEWGQNLRINMGAYGGTAEASMPPYDWAILADLTNDGKVDSNDLAAFVNYWLDSGECIPSDLSCNQFVDFVDFALLGQDWFLETSWYTP